MATVTEMGTKQDAANATTTVITLAVGASVGDVVVVAMMENVASTVSSVVDSRSNTWTQRVQLNTGAGTAGRLVVYDTVVTTAMLAGDTITITAAGLRAGAAWVGKATPMAATPFDQAVSGRASVAGTAATSGNTAALAQADEIAIAGVGWVTDTTFAPGSGWSQAGLTANLKTSIGNVARLEPMWQETSSTAAIAGTGTLGLAEGWTAFVVTYKVGVAAGPVVAVPTVVTRQAVQRASNW